ncbi:MAG TPA: carboxymuconolactone decarboxylase family protein [Gammaproteobacteria bacterium]|nr:carboxymuconolactone decarboxylase family protein [Gammaproteobacteria bacterium]
MPPHPGALPERMPPIADARMSRAQKAAARKLRSGRHGAIIGPFIPALRSPELALRLERLGEYVRLENALGPRLTEFAILLTAREWTQQFEWHVHAPIAAEQGVSPSAIRAIAEGRRPPRMRRDESVVYDFVAELHRARSVGDAIYRRAVRALGEAGVVDLIGVVGYYTTLAMLMNVARTPLPPGEEPGLEALPQPPYSGAD